MSPAQISLASLLQETLAHYVRQTSWLTVVLSPWKTVQVWRARIRYRRDLQRLVKVGPHMIDDIGLTISEARQESSKHLWRP